MNAYDGIGQELFIGDVVAVPINTTRGTARVVPGRVDKIYESKPTYYQHAHVKVRLEVKDGVKRSVDPREKCLRLEGFDFDAYLADI